jgi:hypothetical protein
MTAFNSSDIPADINTIEKLEVWVSHLLTYLNSDLAVVEATGSQGRAANSAPFYITASDPAVWRNISRVSVPLDREWQGGGNIWSYAKELSTAAIPATFKS